MQARRDTRVAGAGVVALAIWGGLIPFVGPTFGYSMGNTAAWTWTEGRATLHVAPAVVALLGGLLLLAADAPARRRIGALLAGLGGVWFVIAPTLHPLWQSAAATGGHMMSGIGMSGMSGAMSTGATSAGSQALQGLGYHYGVGALLAVLGAYAFGRTAVLRSSAESAAPAGIARRGFALTREPSTR